MASSKPSSPGTTHNISEGNLRDAEAEMTFLEKENFDLKMRVYYLEESMTGGMSGASEMDGSGRNRSRSNGRHHVSSVDGDANLKISELHLGLEEKKAELEQRNMLLTKSKEMMEKMKSAFRARGWAVTGGRGGGRLPNWMATPSGAPGGSAGGRRPISGG